MVATKKEWLAQGWEAVQEAPYKHDRWVFVPRIIVVLLLGLALAAATYNAYAEAVFQGQGQGVTITVYNEPCKLTDVTNLPYRATWEENGKVTEGCIAPRPDAGVVVGYFADKTVALMPLQMFKKLVSA
jgi:hypothetical protein